jgi:hypothetical protein
VDNCQTKRGLGSSTPSGLAAKPQSRFVATTALWSVWHNSKKRKIPLQTQMRGAKNLWIGPLHSLMSPITVLDRIGKIIAFCLI